LTRAAPEEPGWKKPVLNSSLKMKKDSALDYAGRRAIKDPKQNNQRVQLLSDKSL